VSLHGIYSDVQCLLSGVQQGSVLGPLVFKMYTHSLGIIAQPCVIIYYFYVAETQLYISLDPDNELNFSSSLKNLKHSITDIWLWMIQNLLILNDNKTNIIYLVLLNCVKSLNTPELQMGTSSITPNKSIKNLGVIFTNVLTCINQYADLPTTILRTSTV